MHGNISLTGAMMGVDGIHAMRKEEWLVQSIEDIMELHHCQSQRILEFVDAELETDCGIIGVR